LLDSHSGKEFSKDFSKHTSLSSENYFKQFLGCLGLFANFSKRKGFCNFSQLPNIDDQVQASGITPENLKIFIRQNSMPFSTESNNSFRSRVNQTLDNVPDFYKPFFYNHFLETPFIELNSEEFCLPDPFSFTESCWNQVRGIVFQEENRKRLERLLGNSFESYLENVLLPFISPDSFEKIPEVQNSISGKKDKRADFLIKTSSSYIVLECKSSIMSSDTSAYFQADKLAELWCRMHIASEQIGATAEALNLCDKPVIPLIITFYDSIAASSVFEEMIKQTDYCSRMGLNMPPIVHSLHEFEHLISDRSLNNWAELVLSKQNASPLVKPDHKGHSYRHLRDVSIL
jgi:hypothetical protein